MGNTQATDDAVNEQALTEQNKVAAPAPSESDLKLQRLMLLQRQMQQNAPWQ